MRSCLIGSALLLFSVTSGWTVSPINKYVTPLKADIQVFARNSMTSPVFTVKTGEWLLVMETKGDRLKVRDSKGNIGWIDKASAREVTPGESMTFENADVYSYLDNPAPVYILDATDPLNNSIKLKRSFANELRENIDRPTVDRIFGAYKPMM